MWKRAEGLKKEQINPGSVRYACEKCTYTTTDESHLRMHKKLRHGNDIKKIEKNGQ